jgi:lipoprotein NlpD
VSALPPPVDAARSRPAKGVYHLVKKGETLSRIAQAYGVPAETVREANRLTRRDHVEAGRALFIPGAKDVIEDTRPRAARKPAKPPPAAKSVEKKAADRVKKGPGKVRDAKPAGKAAPAKETAKRPETRGSRPAEAAPATKAKPDGPAAKKPGTAEAGGRAGTPAPAQAKPAAKAPVRAEPPAAPAGRITVAEGLVYFSEADREKAEKAEAEAKARAEAAAKEPPPKPRERPGGTPETQPKPLEETKPAKTAPPEPPRPETVAPPVRKAPPEEKPEKVKRKKLLWPVKGRVITRFGLQPNGMHSNGIRIAAKEGAPVLAAERGTVLFSAPLKDYGETVILRHDDSYATVYTNLGSRLVNADDSVRAGTRIGLVGRDERAAAGALHFEVRIKNKAYNPLLFLN